MRPDRDTAENSIETKRDRRMRAPRRTDTGREPGDAVRVLLLTEDPETRRHMVKDLESAGYRVTTAEGLWEAVRQVGQDPPGMVLISMRIRDVTDPNFVRHISLGYDIPVLFIAAGGSRDVAVAFEAGGGRLHNRPPRGRDPGQGGRGAEKAGGTRGQSRPRHDKTGNNDHKPPATQRDHIGQDGAAHAVGVQPFVGAGIQCRAHHEPRCPDRPAMGPGTEGPVRHSEDHPQEPAAEAGRRRPVAEIHLHGAEDRIPDGTPRGWAAHLQSSRSDPVRINLQSMDDGRWYIISGEGNPTCSNLERMHRISPPSWDPEATSPCRTGAVQTWFSSFSPGPSPRVEARKSGGL